MKIRPLSEHLQEKAKRELNEIPHQIEENLGDFRNWLSKQEHIKYKDDDQLLLNFLRGSKFSMERAKAKLDAFYTFRTLAPEFSQNLNPFESDTQAYLRLGMAVPLSTPKDDPTSARVLLVRFRDYDPDEVTMTTSLKAASMILNILLQEDDNYVVGGIKIVWDLQGAHYKTALQCTPDLIKKAVFCYEKAFPTRFKAMYVINVPTVFEGVFNLAKMLFSKKLGKRLYFYSNNNLEEIFKDIPRCIFPKEYGGNAGLHADLAAEWKKTVEGHCESLLAERNYYTDESKRPENPQTQESLFGLDGTFRKLEID